jgi:hypothetical protein
MCMTNVYTNVDLQGAFLAELSAAAQAAPAAARLVVTITSATADKQQAAGGSDESDGAPAAVSWLQGRLTAAALAAAVPDAATRDLYVSVPPPPHPAYLQPAAYENQRVNESSCGCAQALCESRSTCWQLLGNLQTAAWK